MKIVIAHYKYYIQGGPERYMLKFIELAKNHGCETIPFSINYSMNLESPYSKYFVTNSNPHSTGQFSFSNLSLKSIIKGSCRQFHNKEAYDNLKKLIHNEKPDLLYCLIPGELSADIFRAAKECNIPVILRISDFRLLCGCYNFLRDGNICTLCREGNYFYIILNRCMKKSIMLSTLRCLSLWYNKFFDTYRFVDAVITPPSFTKDIFIESRYFKNKTITVNNTFLDCNDIIPHYNNQGYVLCLGRYSIEKGFIYAIKSLLYLKSLNIKIAITGDIESCDKETQEFIKSNNLDDKVLFLGFLKGEALKDAIANAMCIACPAIWYENLPNTVIEAYAYGKPVIASNIGCFTEIVEDGKTGLLFEKKNAEELAKCVRRLYEDEALCIRMGKNAREKCERDFSPEKHWNIFMEVYNSIKQCNYTKERRL